MQLLEIWLTTAFYIYLLGKEPSLIAYTIAIIEKLLFSIKLQAIISTSHNRNLAKIYTNAIKYSDYNDIFLIILTIFYNICFRADIPSETKMKIFLIILKNAAQDNYLLNIDINNIFINFN